jgi:hypothetical protein
MSDVPAWALLGDKKTPRSLEIRDRRLSERTDSHSRSRESGEQLDGASVSSENLP